MWSAIAVLAGCLVTSCSADQSKGGERAGQGQADPLTSAGTDAESQSLIPASLKLQQLDSSWYDLSRLTRDSATILLILSPECPLCHDYAFAFRTLGEQQPAQGIRIIGVFPGLFFTDMQIRRYASRFRLDFPMLKDPDYALIRSLGADTTPEAILLDSNGLTIYQGSLDNWAYELGRKRLEPTEHYLRDAIAALQKGEDPPLSRTKAIGCLIE